MVSAATFGNKWSLIYVLSIMYFSLTCVWVQRSLNVKGPSPWNLLLNVTFIYCYVWEKKNRHHLAIPQWNLYISKNTCREENKDEYFLFLVSLPLSEKKKHKNKNGKLRIVVSLITMDSVCVPAHVYTWVCVSFQRTTQIKWKKNQFAHFTVNQSSLSDSLNPTVASISFYLSFCPMSL